MTFVKNKIVIFSCLSKFGLLASLLALITISGCQPQDGKVQNNDASRILLVSDDEPGEPIVVSGTVFAPDGKTPVPGIRIYVYHTDAAGNYNWLRLGRPLGMPRIKGTMISDSQGRYQYRSIKPAPYPNKKIKPHIHYIVEGGGYSEQKFKLSIVDTAPDDPSGFSERRQLQADETGLFRSTLNLKLQLDPSPS